ncbi:hypothetical protein ONZ45_g10134 [Pleurotus djamor]|nr:hypothetical protein ONZ45_g10134 [Pleurotus djamor]
MVTNDEQPVSIHRLTETIESYIIGYENQQDLVEYQPRRDGPHGYVFGIPFEAPAGTKERDYIRTLAGLIFSEQISFHLDARHYPDGDEPSRPTGMPWKQWPKYAFTCQLRITGWVSVDEFPSPSFNDRKVLRTAKLNQGEAAPPNFLPHIIRKYRDFANTYRLMTKSKDVDWSELDDVVQIESWTKEERALPLHLQGNVPIVTASKDVHALDPNGEEHVLARVSSFKITEFEAAVAKAERAVQKGKGKAKENAPVFTSPSPPPPPVPIADKPRPVPRRIVRQDPPQPLEGHAVGPDGELLDAEMLTFAHSPSQEE